jgi:NAD(P)H-dependent FMN reductase
MKLFIPIILGTARDGRRSEKAARFVLKEFQKRNEAETELIDVRDYRIGATDDTEEQEPAKRFAAQATRADGFIIVSPEYNHGYSGELKMMLDMLYEEYNRKPVGICGVAGGGMGGVRMVEQLRLVAIEFKMVPINKAVYFSNAGKLFDEQGNITDETYHERMKAFFEELLWYAKALKTAREQ